MLLYNLTTTLVNGLRGEVVDLLNDSVMVQFPSQVKAVQVIPVKFSRYVLMQLFYV